MKVLVETATDLEPIRDPLLDTDVSGVVIGEANRMGDVFAADEAVSRVLDGRESRTDAFSQEDLVALHGLEQALESGLYDTSGRGMQIIPSDMSRQLLTAMKLFAEIPEEEKAQLTDTEQHQWAATVEALANIDIVPLKPGVSPEEVVIQITLDLTTPEEQPTTTANNDFDWLYADNGTKAGRNLDQAYLPLHEEDVERIDGEIHLTAPVARTEPVEVGVGVYMPDFPTGHWEPGNVLSYAEHERSREATQQWTPGFIKTHAEIELPPEAVALLNEDTKDVPVTPFDDSDRQLFARDDSGDRLALSKVPKRY